MPNHRTTVDPPPALWRLPDADGVVACVQAGASLMWADHLLAQAAALSVVWVATGTEPEQYGIMTVQRPGVWAAAVAPAGADTRAVQIALQVAGHLTTSRTARNLEFQPALTAMEIPRIPPGHIRIPHLVDVLQGDHVTPIAVWEIAHRVAAATWLAVELPEQEFFEAHLPQLLQLRANARKGIVPNTHAGQRLRALTRTFPLSIELVYRHPDLFRILLQAQASRTGRAGHNPAAAAKQT